MNWTAKKYALISSKRGSRKVSGRVCMSMEAEKGEKAIKIATAPTERVEARSGRDGRDLRKGIFAVRATWMIKICERAPNTNQPAQKRGIVSEV